MIVFCLQGRLCAFFCKFFQICVCERRKSAQTHFQQLSSFPNSWPVGWFAIVSCVLCLVSCVSLVSLLCLSCVSLVSLLCLSCVSLVSLLCLSCVSLVSLLCLSCVSLVSLLCLSCVSLVSLLCLLCLEFRVWGQVRYFSSFVCVSDLLCVVLLLFSFFHTLFSPQEDPLSLSAVTVCFKLMSERFYEWQSRSLLDLLFF